VTDALADIAYLARSENRVLVLQTLADGPVRRDDLRERTGLPRQTLSRILDELDARGWVDDDHARLTATPLGAYVLREFEGLHDRLTAANDVADALRYLPEDAADLGVEAYLGSEVVRATPGDPLSPVRRAIEGIGSADEVRILAGAVTAETLGASLRAVEGRGQRFEAVFAPRVVEAIRADDTLGSLVADLLAREGVTLYAGSEAVDYSVGVGEGRVEFGLTDDRGAPSVYLATTDERVVTWASERLDAAVAAADPLTLE
jgi:predicted transcriptional regulator